MRKRGRKTIPQSKKKKGSFRKKTEIVLLTLLIGWIVGGTLHGLLGDTTTQYDSPVPSAVIADILQRLPEHQYYLIFDEGTCGAPFQMTVNYLHNRSFDADIAVLTSADSSPRLRGLANETGLTIVPGFDDIVKSVTDHTNALLIERTEQGQLLVYPFYQPSMSEFVAVLDDVFGMAEQRYIVGKSHVIGKLDRRIIL